MTTTRIILWACPLCETPATDGDNCANCGTAFEACVEYDVEIDRSPDTDWESEAMHILSIEDWRLV